VRGFWAKGNGTLICAEGAGFTTKGFKLEKLTEAMQVAMIVCAAGKGHICYKLFFSSRSLSLDTDRELGLC